MECINKYYVIGRDQVTDKILVTATDNLSDAKKKRRSLHLEYHDTMILSAQDLSMITKPGWVPIGETLEIYNQ